MIQLCIKEQQRDGESLPIDLWKRSVSILLLYLLVLTLFFTLSLFLQSMKDIPGVPSPHIVEDFIQSLKNGGMSTKTPSNKSIVEIPQVLTVFVCTLNFDPQAHFDKCINHLRSAVLEREKECYML